MTMIYRVRGYYFTNLQQAMVMAKNHVEDKVEEKYIESMEMERRFYKWKILFYFL